MYMNVRLKKNLFIMDKNNVERLTFANKKKKNIEKNTNSCLSIQCIILFLDLWT